MVLFLVRVAPLTSMILSAVHPAEKARFSSTKQAHTPNKLQLPPHLVDYLLSSKGNKLTSKIDGPAKNVTENQQKLLNQSILV